MGKKRGYAFIFVLCVSVLISALLMGVLTLSLNAKKSTKYIEDTYKLTSISESGIEKGMSCLKQNIQKNPAIFSDKSTSLASHDFSFNDSGISCKVEFTDDNTDSANPIIEIHSTAKTSKGKTKEDFVYIKKTDISNTYFDMLFNNVVTVLGKKNEADSNYKTAFDMGDCSNDMSLDGNIYLQGNTVNFKPKPDVTVDTALNLLSFLYNNDYKPQFYYGYYDPTTGSGPVKKPYQDIDKVASFYNAGTVHINCNTLNLPSSSQLPTDASAGIYNILNSKVMYADTTIPLSTDDAKKVGKYVSNEYPLLNIEYDSSDTTLKDLKDYYTQTNYKIYFIPPSGTNANLATFLVTKVNKDLATSFDFTALIDAAKKYIEDNRPEFNGMTYIQKEALYKKYYQLYLIDGDVNYTVRAHHVFPYTSSWFTDYNNIIVYSTGKMNVDSEAFLGIHIKITIFGVTLIDYTPKIENFSLQNSSIMARSIKIEDLPDKPIAFNISGCISDLSLDYIDTPFERSVSLHGIKSLSDPVGSNGLSPFSAGNRNSVNLFLSQHLVNYSQYYTFKIDKWVEK